MPYKDIEKRREYSRKARNKWRENPVNREKDRTYNRKWAKEHKHPCPVCGILIDFQSTYCRKHRLLPLGDKSYHWKGGRANSCGYILIYKPNHPRVRKDKYVLEHILIWEQTHGKPLPQGWIIHHLNGIRNDNRPSNLIALPDKKHRHILAAKAKRIQELESLLNGQASLL